jgi:hypothetical protein
MWFCCAPQKHQASNAKYVFLLMFAVESGAMLASGPSPRHRGPVFRGAAELLGINRLNLREVSHGSAHD